MTTVTTRNMLRAPWQTGTGLSNVIVGEGGEAIATVLAGRTADETRARSNLVAAAPDLLAAVKAFLRSEGKNSFELRHELSLAVEKAEGGAP